MYQTLQQRLKKLQSLLGKWPNSSIRQSQNRTTPNQNSTIQPIISSSEVQEKNDTGALSLAMLTEEFTALKTLWREVQQNPIEIPQYGQALHTEMHKQFRLIEVDLTFLKTARQEKTIAQRKQQLCDRLHKLIEYCETGIKLSQQKP